MKCYYRILQTHDARTHSRTHACTHAHTHARARTHAHTHTPTHTHTPPSPFRFDASVAPKRDEVNAPFSPVPLAFMAGSWVIQMNTRAGDPLSLRFWMSFAYKKMIGRTETRTRCRMYCQTIRTVRNISQDDRARIATCSLLTPTDRQTYVRRIIVQMQRANHVVACIKAPVHQYGRADEPIRSSLSLSYRYPCRWSDMNDTDSIWYCISNSSFKQTITSI